MFILCKLQTNVDTIYISKGSTMCISKWLVIVIVISCFEGQNFEKKLAFLENDDFIFLILQNSKDP